MARGVHWRTACFERRQYGPRSRSDRREPGGGENPVDHAADSAQRVAVSRRTHVNARSGDSHPLGARMKTNLSVLTKLPANLGSLGLGSTIGTAAGLVAYFSVPTLSNHLSAEAASGLGGALGGATGAAAATVLTPILRKGSHYLLMLELDAQVRFGWLTPARATYFRRQLQEQYFGSIRS